jgi:hypothetical protein
MSPPGQGGESAPASRAPRRGQMRVERYREMVAWRESAAAGVGALLAGLVLTAAPLWWFGFGADLAVGTLELAVLVLVEGVGATVNQGELAASLSAYGVLDSSAFGVGPAVLLAGAGHHLAGRHVAAGATERPLETVLAGGSLALWFAPALALVAVVTTVTVDQSVSLDVAAVFVAGLLYAGVFATLGAAIRSQALLTSSRSLVAGPGAFVAALVVWSVSEAPVEERPAGGGADLDGAVAYLDLLSEFVESTAGEGEILPAWVVVAVALAFGAGLSVAAGQRDPLVGAGEGARLGATYGATVALVVLGHVVAVAAEFQGVWETGQVVVVNELLAAAPRTVLVAGVVYPVVFAAIGGGVGAVVYRCWQGG